MSKKYLQMITIVSFSCCANFPLIAYISDEGESLFDDCCGILGSTKREMNTFERKTYEVMSKKYLN
jgi:hypothetical protein